MEDDDNISNSSDGDQNRILQQRSNLSSMSKESIWYDLQHFPDSLLIEILARLPVKTIFRFKSVCKHWQTLISHPFFSRFYHSILDSNSNAAALPFRIMDTLPNFKEFVNSLAPEIHSSSVLFLHNPKEQRQYDRFVVLNVSNGLILCRSWSRTETVYYICDPLTRKWIIRPRHGRHAHDFFREGLITRVNEDHMLTGYTLVRTKVLNSPSNYLNLDMFSSETGEWINYNLHCAIPINSCSPIHCYGAIHWQVGDDGCHGMVAFDPYKDPKSVRLIPAPNDRDLHLQCECEYGGAFELYGECQGTLRYFQVACDPTKLYFLTMWALKDYEKGEWCCEFKVRRIDVHSSNLELSKWLVDGWFFPLSLHPLNPNVVYLTGMHPKCIVSYDVLNRRLDVASKPIDVYGTKKIQGLLLDMRMVENDTSHGTSMSVKEKLGDDSLKNLGKFQYFEEFTIFFQIFGA